MSNEQKETGGNGSFAGMPALLAVLSVCFVVLFTAYFFTAAPGAWWGDGMELTCAAATLGIPHPTGYPFYVTAGHLLIRLFGFIEPSRVMTLFSAACCAAGAMLIGLASGAWMFRSRSGGFTAVPACLLCAGVSLATGFTRTLWEHATFPEVYPLAFLLVSAMVGRIAWNGEEVRPAGGSCWFSLSVLWGLAMLHHYSALAVLPMVLIAVGLRGGRLSARSLGGFVAVSVLFLAGYGFVWFRAGANPPLNWGDPSEWDRFLAHITGGDYGALNQLRRASADGMLSGALFWLGWWGRQILPEPTPGYIHQPTAASLVLGAILVSGSIAGCRIIFGKARVLGTGLLLSLAVTLAFSLVYLIPDRDGYFLPALPAMMLGWVALIQRLCDRAGHLPLRWGMLAGIAAIAGAVLLASVQWREVDKGEDNGPALWADAVLDVLPQNALVITQPGNDGEIYALWHAQMVQGKRPDVTVLGGGFIFKGWYRKYFAHPSRPQIPLFITDRPPTDKRTFDAALAAGVVMPNLDTREVFFTYPESNPWLQLTPVQDALAVEEIGRYRKYLQTGGTTYPFILPSGRLARATMDASSREAARQAFGMIFGLEPPR